MARAAKPDDLRAGALRDPARLGDLFRFPHALTGHELAVTIRRNFLIIRLETPAIQRDLYAERHRVDHRNDHRSLAGHHEYRQAHQRTSGADQAGAPAAGHVQRCKPGAFSPCLVGIFAECLTWSAGQLAPRGWRYCWIHRAAYDHGLPPHAHESLSKMPRGVSLYGSLPAQLQDSTSFARRLGEILAVRKRYGIAASIQLDVPHVSTRRYAGHGAPLTDAEQVTVLNFCACHRRECQLRSPGARAALVDMFTDEEVGEVDDLHTFAISLEPHEVSLLARVPVIIWQAHPQAADLPSARRGRRLRHDSLTWSAGRERPVPRGAW